MTFEWTIFRNGEDIGGKTFDEYFKNYLPATNPNLALLFGLETNAAISFLPELKGSIFGFYGFLQKTDIKLPLHSCKCDSNV